MGRYRIQIEDSKTIKDLFLDEDMAMDTHPEIESFITELTDALIIVHEPTKVEYWGGLYDGELEMIFEDIDEVQARRIFKRLCSASSIETNLILVDIHPKYIGEAKILERTTGENYMLYLF